MSRGRRRRWRAGTSRSLARGVGAESRSWRLSCRAPCPDLGSSCRLQVRFACRQRKPGEASFSVCCMRALCRRPTRHGDAVFMLPHALARRFDPDQLQDLCSVARQRRAGVQCTDATVVDAAEKRSILLEPKPPTVAQRRTMALQSLPPPRKGRLKRCQSASSFPCCVNHSLLDPAGNPIATTVSFACPVLTL